MRLHSDEQVIERDKILMTLKWFYTDKIPSDMNEAISLVYAFIVGNPDDDPEAGANDYPKNKKSQKKEKTQFDYEFDAEEIYTSFLFDYGIDLIETNFMHWYKFKILLQNLSSETPFAQKIRLRFLDLKQYKGEQYSKLSRAKRRAQIPAQYSREEAAAMKRLLSKIRE
jgi:hypothetical protein